MSTVRKEVSRAMSTQMSLLWLFSSVGLVCADFRISISTRVGSSVTLPCDWRNVPEIPVLTTNPHIEWRTMTDIVFERRGQEVYQGEEYEDRADVLENKLLSGDCSLVLKNVKMTDAGPYESHLLVRRTKRSLTTKRVFIQSVELSVDDTPEKVAPVEAQQVKAAQHRESDAGMTTLPLWTLALSLALNLLFYTV